MSDDIVIVGAGFSGLGAAIRLKQAGIHDFTILERGTRVGGTWRDNTYPGCACDVPSALYSFSFAPNPQWTRTYAQASEIHAYLQRLVADHDLGPHLRLGCELAGGAWDEHDHVWRLETSDGPRQARIVICATGPLIEPAIPAIPGLDQFDGPVFHSSAWEHEHDLSGKRVAVIGTGASAIQLVPHVQHHADQLLLFQRTPAWVLPRLDRTTTLIERQLMRVPGVANVVRGTLWSVNEVIGLGFHTEPRLLRPLEALARAHLRRQVEDPVLRAKLTPDFRMGCKRILASDSYYRAATAANTAVITDGIREVTDDAIVTRAGTEHGVDVVILATGFRVPVGPAIEQLAGRDGRTVADQRDPGDVEAHLGLTFSGMPNLFNLVGPNTGLGHNSLLYMIESQITYVVDAVQTMRREHLAAFDVRADAQAHFNAKLQAASQGTVWLSGGCDSWYLNAAGKNTTLWPRSTIAYRRATSRFDRENYHLVAA